jgi:hypothetical protein
MIKKPNNLKVIDQHEDIVTTWFSNLILSYFRYGKTGIQYDLISSHVMLKQFQRTICGSQ